jgi:phosphoribosylformylglycinamidine synthase
MDDLAGSEYLSQVHGLAVGRPRIDLDLEARVQHAALEAHAQGLLRSCHDCAEGGVAVALVEAAIWGNVGFQVDARIAGRRDAALFGERASRFIVTVAEADIPALLRLARSDQVGARSCIVGGERLSWEGAFDVPLSVAAAAWRGALMPR